MNEFGLMEVVTDDLESSETNEPIEKQPASTAVPANTNEGWYNLLLG